MAGVNPTRKYHVAAWVKVRAVSEGSARDLVEEALRYLPGVASGEYYIRSVTDLGTAPAAGSDRGDR